MIFKCDEIFARHINGVTHYNLRGDTIAECMTCLYNTFPQLAVAMATETEEFVKRFLFTVNGELPTGGEIEVGDSDVLEVITVPTGGFRLSSLNPVKVLSNAYNAVTDIGGDVWDATKDLGGAAWEGVKDLGGDVWEGVKDLGGGVWQEVKGIGGEVWNFVKDAGGNIFDLAAIPAGYIFNAAAGVVQWVGSSVVNTLVEHGPSIVYHTSNIASDIAHVVDQVIIEPVVNTIEHVVIPVVTAVGDVIWDIAEPVVDAVVDFVGDVIHVVGDVTGIDQAIRYIGEKARGFEEMYHFIQESPFMKAFVGFALQEMGSNKFMRNVLQIMQYAAFIVACIPGLNLFGLAASIAISFFLGLMDIATVYGAALIAQAEAMVMQGRKYVGSWSPTYNFSGISNTTASGTIIPVVYGTHRVGGTVLNLYTQVEYSTDTILYAQFGLCEGEIEAISNIHINGYPSTFYDALVCVDNDQDYSRRGLPTQSAMGAFSAVQNSTTYERKILKGV